MTDHISAPSPDESGSGAEVAVLDPAEPAHRERIAELLGDRDIRVVDTLAAQRASLRSVVPPPADDLVAESRWVHYPWRSAMVLLLGPRGFRRLRLDRNHNKITEAEQDTLRARRVGVVGLSVGHAVAHTIAIEGSAGMIRLADFDEIDLSNLNRVPASVFDIGVNKAVVAARRIAEIDPYLSVEIMQVGIDENTAGDFLDGLDLVLEECDSFDAKVLVRDRARALGIPVVMETSDGGVLDIERFDLEPDRPLFHGLLGDIDTTTLAGLSTAEKVPLALTLLDAAKVTPRMAASALEVGATLATWPQLGGDVALGGASCAVAVRRLGLGLPLPSGRVRIDIDAQLDTVIDPVAAPAGGRPLLGGSTAAATDRPRPPVEIFDELPDVDAIVFAGARAPSAYNTQPWVVAVDDAGITATIDEATPPGPTDIDRRAAAVALGAMAHNMSVAAAARHRLGAVLIADDATVRLRFGTDHDVELADDIGHVLRRSTSRMPGDASPLTDDESAALRSAGPGVHVLTERAALAHCAALLGDGARVRHLTPALHAEMIGARRGGDTGVDIESLGVPPSARGMLDLVSRPEVMAHLSDWDAGSVLGAPTTGLVMSSSAVVAVTVSGWGRRDFVRGGMIAEAVWLRATALGLAVAPVVPPSLYAADTEQRRAVSADRVAQSTDVDHGLRAAFGLDPDTAVAIVLRVFRNPTPVPVSRRRRLS